MKISGIYKITCVKNKKFYIGSSKNLNKRFYRHKNELINNKHPNRYLQSAWNKYKEDNFRFEILEQIPINLLIEAEQKWLDKTKCYKREIGFNLSQKANSTIGIKFSMESRNKKAKEYIVVNPLGEEYRIINLVNFCATMQLKLSSMYKLAKSKISNYKGWKCRPANLSHEEWFLKIPIKKDNGNNQKWLMINPNGKEIITDNLQKFCEQNNLKTSIMRKIGSGFSGNQNGWSCRRAGMSLKNWLELQEKRKIEKQIQYKKYYQNLKFLTQAKLFDM